MKRLCLLILPLVLLLASCSKTDVGPRPPIDESEWLRKERGVVVASDFNCDFFVVETPRGYSVLRAWGGFPPRWGAVIYGDLSNWGVRAFYNRSEGYLMNADVRDYWLPYFTAMDEMNWNCNLRGG